MLEIGSKVSVAKLSQKLLSRLMPRFGIHKNCEKELRFQVGLDLDLVKQIITEKTRTNLVFLYIKSYKRFQPVRNNPNGIDYRVFIEILIKIKSLRVIQTR